MRTDGSLIKAPGVVCRPVQSISWRSMIRIGETVVVPIGCSLTRCGISEPVMKTRPLFDFLLTLRSLVARGVGKHRSGKHAGRDENCSA